MSTTSNNRIHSGSALEEVLKRMNCQKMDGPSVVVLAVGLAQMSGAAVRPDDDLARERYMADLALSGYLHCRRHFCGGDGEKSSGNSGDSVEKSAEKSTMSGEKSTKSGEKSGKSLSKSQSKSPCSQSQFKSPQWLQFTRPADYFAEMLKSDAHMDRIRAALATRAAELDAARIARDRRDARRFATHLAAQRRHDRATAKDDKKQALKKISGKSSGNSGDFDAVDTHGDEFGVEVEQERKRVKVAPGKKRIAKNAKFGYPKRDKRNDAQSSLGLDSAGKSTGKSKGKAFGKARGKGGKFAANRRSKK